MKDESNLTITICIPEILENLTINYRFTAFWCVTRLGGSQTSLKLSAGLIRTSELTSSDGSATLNSEVETDQMAAAPPCH